MTYISDELRRIITERATAHCEYCLLPTIVAYPVHEVDHIYAEKHGGPTEEPNLCLSCFDCNRHKGSDLCSLDPFTGNIVALFHPRAHQWSEHFRLNGAYIEPLTPQGRVTARLLRLNDDERVEERARLMQIGHYP